MKFLAAVTAAALFVPAISAKEAPSPMVNVKSYTSALGRYSLEVDPTDLYGRGQSRCRLTENGREVWAADLPFTFSEAVVTDDGTVAGYGYKHGLGGWAKQGGINEGPGEARIAILDARGGFRLDEKIPRERSLALHAGPEPTVSGLVPHAADDRLIARIHGEGIGEKWRVYALSTGKRVGELDVTPSSESERGIVGVAAVAGPPLTLVHWWHYDDNGRREPGARFTLVDLDGKRVWSLTKEADYSIPKDEEAEDRLRTFIREKSAILERRESGEFELWFAADAQRVVHSVKRDAGGWRVAEISRRAYTPPKDAPTPPEIPVRPLEELGTFVLEGKPERSPVRDVMTFGFDAGGRIGFLRATDRIATAFVLVDQAGKLLAEIPLALPKEHSITLTWITDDRWLIASSPSRPDAKARAWWLERREKGADRDRKVRLSSRQIARAVGRRRLRRAGHAVSEVLVHRRTRRFRPRRTASLENRGQQWNRAARVVQPRGDHRDDEIRNRDRR